MTILILVGMAVLVGVLLLYVFEPVSYTHLRAHET